MTYDYHGGWSRFTGGNSPLFSRYHDRFDPRLSIEWSVKRWIKAGAPPKKLILGNIHEIPSWSILEILTFSVFIKMVPDRLLQKRHDGKG